VITADRDAFLEQCLEDIRFLEDSPARVSLSGTLKADFPGFEGHFPGKPLLAGAFQIELITAIAGRLIDPSWAPTCIEHARFRKMVRPGDTIKLQASLASREASRASVKAVLFRDAHKACQATLVFAAD
jgi:3-hydroxymyristoyl/3-hydroxydecanoyl-(acyl carrier protein) dehydratase